MIKVFHVFFALALIALAAFFIQQYDQKSRAEAIASASEELTLTRDIRVAQLKSEVKTFYSEVSFWVESKTLRDTMQTLLASWYDLSFAPKIRARQLYIENNPLFPHYSANFVNAGDGSEYSNTHEKLHKLLKTLTKRRGYYDVFVIANNGDVVYSVYKEDDFGTNLVAGKYKDTGLAIGFREVQDNTSLNHVALTDFKPYQPSNNAPASFIQTSVVNDKNKTIGTLAFQLPIEPIDKILNSTAGLGKGTEIFAVGSDHFFRKKLENRDDRKVINSDAIEKALKGETGVEQFVDYNGVETISAYAPFEFSHNILGSTNKNIWAIIVKQDLAEILDPVAEKNKRHLFILLGIILISLILAWLFTRGKDDLSTTEEEG